MSRYRTAGASLRCAAMKILAVLIVLAACSPPRAPVPPVATNPLDVATTEGRVLGHRAGDVDVFLGVPYAQPPLGPLRWREPVPPLAHAPLTADHFHLPCAQIPVPAGGDAFGSGKKIESSEDCLYLNVWVPKHAANEPLPVMVWIHGGQYIRGSASQYDGEQLARLGHVMVVTMDYRLGPMGFLAHPALTAESPHHTSGNQAMLDHVQALRWLHANLAAFGGDPARVTVFGESGGSASACAMLTSPLARGLVARVILESDACLAGDDTPALAQREELGKKLSQALACAGQPDELACMRGKSQDDVLGALALGKVLADDGGASWVPALDGYVFTETSEQSIQAGHQPKIPVLMGTVDNELGRYATGAGVKTVDEYQKRLAKDWEGDAPKIAQLYPVTADDQVLPQLGTLFSDWGMTCPTRRDVRWFAAAGVPVYLYRYMRAPNILQRSQGAFHGAELVSLFPSVFASHGWIHEPDDDVVTNVLVGYWSRFAATGDPNGSGALAWPRYEARSDPYMALDVTPHVGTGLRAAQCDVWDHVNK